MSIRWIVLPLGLLASVALAGDGAAAKNGGAATNDAGAAPTKEQIAAKLHGVAPADITDSPLPGVYQVKVGSTVAYVSKDGRYLIEGDIYDLSTSQNITEDTRAKARAELLAGVSKDDMIVFAPKDGNVKHTITMFTDIDCGYCRQFHRDIDKVTALGIEVHYLFFPRTGPNTESWTKAEEVWCAKDRKSALTKAKLGGSLPNVKCADTPVEEHWELGHEVGVRGTPAIFAENGALLGGYLTPEELEKRLEDASKPNDAAKADQDAPKPN